MAPITRTFISPEEIHNGLVVTYDDLVPLASALNRNEGLHFLGFLNLLLSLATVETILTGRLQPVRDVQSWLLREILSEDLLDRLKTKLGEASLLDRPVLHRSQLLFVTRLVATHGRPEGGNVLADRRDFDAIGDLLFLANGLFHPGSAPSSPTAAALWLAAQMGPLHETENPPRLEWAWPRIHDLFTSRLPAAATDPAELDRLERVALFTTGFSLEAWLDLSFLLVSFWSAGTFQELMENRARAYLAPDAQHSTISPEMLRQALVPLSAPFGQLPDTLRIETFSRTTLYDLTPFRASPLWTMPDGTALCVDVALLLERLGAHAFWQVMNALDTPTRRRHFSGAWGAAFEHYCLDQLAHIFRAKTWRFVPNPVDDSDEELWDAVAIRSDGTAVVIECKGTFIPSADKYSGDPLHFFRGLTKKFGRVKHGGIYQLARGIAALTTNSAATSIPGLAGAREIFPVLIVQDPIFESGPVVRVLSDRFDCAIAARTVSTGVQVWPLTVITADALDRLRAIIHATHEPLHQILKTFHRAYPSHMMPFESFLTADAARFDTPAVKAAIKTRFHSVADATMARFEAGTYGGNSGPGKLDLARHTKQPSR